ncbi:MAG: hypothetical protein RR772_07550 [Gordonibacter sp.]
MFAVLGVANLSIDPAVVASWTHLWWVRMVLTAAVVIAFAFAIRELRRGLPEAAAPKPTSIPVC